METSEKTDLIDAALAAAQAEIKPAVKDSVNPHFKSNYADLQAVKEVTREPLAKYGLNVTQNPLTDLERKAIGCYVRIGHKSGQWLRFDPLWVQPARGLAPQDVGSAMTYLRRYTYCAALNITADEDDDGNGAEGRGRSDQVPGKPATSGERAAKMLDAFKTIGWSEADLEEAVGVPLKQFTDTQFALAKDLFETQKRRQAVDKNRARAQFES